jgi:hypothetical protein
MVDEQLYSSVRMDLTLHDHGLNLNFLPFSIVHSVDIHLTQVAQHSMPALAYLKTSFKL